LNWNEFQVTNLFSSPGKAFQHTLTLQAVTLTCLTLAPSLTLVVVALTLLSLVTTLQRVVATDLTIRRGGKQGRGGIMGLNQSIMSLARMLSPLLAGVAQEVHVDGPSVVAVVTTLTALGLMIARLQDPERRKKAKRE
jgi:predicted MFS family arabinose efflux permease